MKVDPANIHCSVPWRLPNQLAGIGIVNPELQSRGVAFWSGNSLVGQESSAVLAEYMAHPGHPCLVDVCRFQFALAQHLFRQWYPTLRSFFDRSQERQDEPHPD